MENEIIVTLTGKARLGDKEAFGELYSLCFTDLYKYALFCLGNREEAEDARGAT